MDGAKDQVTIRELAVDNAPQAANLSAELGYPVSSEVIAMRLADIADAEEHCVLGAFVDDQMAGWIDVGIAQHLQSGRYGEIGGLVVAAAHRGRGIGKALVRAAEEWMASEGVESVVVRSQVAREGAHAFYAHLGYERVKTSAVFRRPLGARGARSEA